jgi:hypothetical protein
MGLSFTVLHCIHSRSIVVWRVDADRHHDHSELSVHVGKVVDEVRVHWEIVGRMTLGRGKVIIGVDRKIISKEQQSPLRK